MTNLKEIQSSDIEEHEYAVYIDEELKRMKRFLGENGADEEMIEVIDQTILDNQMWIHKDLLTSESA